MEHKIADPFVARCFIKFPANDNTDHEDLVAYGGDLSVSTLLSAYVQGNFPWFNSDEEYILWWSPNPRMVLYPKAFKISKSLKQTLHSDKYEVRINTCFQRVIENCARTKRKGQDGTWITPNMQAAYTKLHELGYAHSFETYHGNKLVGGLYGVSIGKAFFGESMFHNMTDASKIALHKLVEICLEYDIHFIDVQQSTPHLKSLGGKEEKRTYFLEILAHAMTYTSVLKKLQVG
ncbi:MAG: leucyl/phenylalanyl-tRNA--protein transferase [Bacteroidetes bacterium]|jgi:leucyl/phenylalanyl-tRNA--protein transferase|nr:leucyl/phenylalanyl-tRNA--protein transferase [Bacteroidota bacterium]